MPGMPPKKPEIPVGDAVGDGVSDVVSDAVKLVQLVQLVGDGVGDVVSDAVGDRIGGVGAPQTLAVKSLLPVKTESPSGNTPTAHTQLVWPLRIKRCSPVAAFQTIAVVSVPVTTESPSGNTASAFTFAGTV